MALDTSRFEAGRRQINDEYAGKQAANEFGRFVGQQRTNRQIGDFKTDFGRGQGRFMGGMARRGLTGGGVRSGAFQQALQQRAGDYTRDLGRMQQDQGMALQQSQLESANIDRWRNDALADLEAQKQREIALAALNIKAIKPMFGG